MRCDIKVVVFSAHAEDEIIGAALLAGVHAYLLKGSAASLLTAAVRAVGAGASWLDPAIYKRFCLPSKKASAARFEKMELTRSLSPREAEVAALLSEGLSNQQIAVKLFLCKDTVKSHVRKIIKKLDARGRTDVAVTFGKMQRLKIGAFC